MASALCRKSRQGDLNAAALMVARGDLARDAETLLVVELDAGATGTAVGLLQRHALRAGDAVQLGAAIELRRPMRRDVRFHAADERLAFADDGEGLAA